MVLLHGFPDDARAWDAVAPPLAAAGYRVLVPYLRGYGPTHFLDPAAPRMAQQAAIAQDLLDFMDALGLERVGLVSGFKFFGTHDWYRQLVPTILEHQSPEGAIRRYRQDRDNLIETAKASIVSAEARKESRGAQARSDYPARDDANWLKHTLWFREGNRLEYKPVRMKPLTVEAFPPKARTY